MLNTLVEFVNDAAKVQLFLRIGESRKPELVFATQNLEFAKLLRIEHGRHAFTLGEPGPGGYPTKGAVITPMGDLMTVSSLP